MKHLFLAAVALTAACAPLTGPDIDYTERAALEPPPRLYRDLYADTERCLGARGDFNAVRWFVADVIDTPGDHLVWGVQSNTDDITILRSKMKDTRTVRHEIAHHITRLGDEIHYDDGRRAICDEDTH